MSNWDPNVEDADRWVTCDQNHEHWGAAGAAGLLLHNNGRYLLQQRSPWVDHGMTWAPPSGALRHGEHPINGAVREAQEEMGEFPFSDPKVIHTNDHGNWQFHTVTAEAPHQFDPELSDEGEDAGWFTPHEIDELPLHPGFRQSWSDIYTPPTEKFSNATTPATEDGGLANISSLRGSAWHFGGLHDDSLSEEHFASGKIHDAWQPVKKIASQPPNLHRALGTSSCETCKHFKAEGRTHMDQKGECKRYDEHVEKDQICGSFEKRKHSKKAAVTRDWQGKPSIEPWQPGTWGKGLITTDGQTHMWETEGPGGSPHHQQYLAMKGIVGPEPFMSPAKDYVVIAPDGSYTQLGDTTYDDPSYFARTQQGMRYIPDRDRWHMRAFSRVAGEELEQARQPAEPKDQASPEEAQVLDQLTIKSIAHNLHYKYEKGPLTIPEATEYAGQLLDMIGYRNPDPMTIGAALQAWRQLYPQDKALSAGPEQQRLAEQRGWTDFYHVSPRANRESIQNLGLMGENGSSPWSDPWKRNQPHGNYFFDNPADAEDYAWNLKSRRGDEEEPAWEDRYEQEEPPGDFHTWPEEKQDEWHDNAEYKEKSEDPEGYDVWKVNTRNLPIHRDPESAINQAEPPTNRQLQQHYRDDDYPSAYDQYGGSWQQQLVDHAHNYGLVPRRFYTPEPVEPERMQLHQHIPAWNMSEEEMYNRMEDPETTDQQVPSSWDEMQLRTPQFPAHSKVTKHLYHWTEARDLDGWFDRSHTGPGETYLTESGEAPGEDWNPDVPTFENPVRLAIDPSHLDPQGFDPTYEGWLGNHLYRGVIPPEAVKDVKSFKPAQDWDLMHYASDPRLFSLPDPDELDDLLPGTASEPVVPEPYYPSATAAAAHAGQIPGDEHYMQDVPSAFPNPNSGVNPSYIGHIGEDTRENRVYVKPEGQFHSNDLAAERAAFAIAHTMGIPMPHTVVRPVSFPYKDHYGYDKSVEGLAQVQQSVGGNQLMASHTVPGAVEDFPEGTRRIGLLDNVIGNDDRHLGNVVRGDDGEVYPIDHGGAFVKEGDYKPRGLAGAYAGAPLTPEEIEALQRARQVDLTQIGLRDAHQEGVHKRIDTMLANNQMLDPYYV